MPEARHADKFAIHTRFRREATMTVDWDEPKKPSAVTITLGEDLSKLSVGELTARADQLKAEIARIEAAATAKRGHAAAAEALFGKR
jgi:uncharacterized small protein (DUF1192 family)